MLSPAFCNTSSPNNSIANPKEIIFTLYPFLLRTGMSSILTFDTIFNSLSSKTLSYSIVYRLSRLFLSIFANNLSQNELDPITYLCNKKALIIVTTYIIDETKKNNPETEFLKVSSVSQYSKRYNGKEAKIIT